MAGLDLQKEGKNGNNKRPDQSWTRINQTIGPKIEYSRLISNVRPSAAIVAVTAPGSPVAWKPNNKLEDDLLFAVFVWGS